MSPKAETEPGIRIVLQGEAPRDFNLKKVVVGRGEKADYVIERDELSRQHLEVSVVNGALHIKDLGSVNGTYVGKKRIPPLIKMRCPRHLTVMLGGRITLTISLITDAEEIALPKAPVGTKPLPPVATGSVVMANDAAEEIELVEPEEKEGGDPTGMITTEPAPSLPPGINPSLSAAGLPVSLLDEDEDEESEDEDEAKAAEKADEDDEDGDEGPPPLEVRPPEPPEEPEPPPMSIIPEELTEEVLRLQQQLRETQERCQVEAKEAQERWQTQVRDTQAECQAQLREFEQWKQANSREREQLERELEARKAEIGLEKSTLQLAIDEIHSQKQLSEKDLATIEASHAQVISETENQRQQNHELTQANERLRAKSEELVNEVKGHTKQLRQTETVLQQTQERIRLAQDQLEETRKNLRNERETHDRFKSAAESERNRISQEIERRKHEIQSETEIERSKLMLGLQELESRRKLQERELSLATSLRTQITAEVDSLRQRSNELVEANQKVQERSEQLQNELKARAEQIAKNDKSLQVTRERIAQGMEQLELLTKTREKETHDFERWKEESAGQRSAMEKDIEQRRTETELEKSRLQLTVKELQSHKILADSQELALAEASRAQVLSELEEYRKSVQELTAIKQKTKEDAEKLKAKLAAIISNHDVGVRKHVKLTNDIDASIAELSKLAVDEQAVRSEIEKLQNEKQAINRALANERTRILEEANASAIAQANALREAARKEADEMKETARKEAEGVREAARRETELVQTESNKKAKELTESAWKEAQETATAFKAQAAKEQEGIRVRAQKEFESQQDAMAHVMAEAKKSQDAEIAERMANMERELGERRRAAEKQIESMVELERQESKLRREREEDESEKRRSRQIHQIAVNLEQALSLKLEEKLAPHDLSIEHLPGVLKDVRGAVEQAFSPDAESELENKRILAVDPEMADRAKRFWIRSGIGAASTIVLVIVVSVFHQPIVAGLARMRPRNNASDEFVKEHNREIASRPKFNPATDKLYKSSYTDNVLYTSNYMEIKSDAEVQKRWVVELNQFLLQELRLNEGVIVKFVATETNLIRKLVELRGFINPTYEKEGIQRMRATEEAATPEFLQQLDGAANYDRVRRFEHSFYLKVAISKGGTGDSVAVTPPSAIEDAPIPPKRRVRRRPQTEPQD